MIRPAGESAPGSGPGPPAPSVTRPVGPDVRHYGVDAAPDGATALRRPTRLRAAVRRTEETPLASGATLVKTAGCTIDLPATPERDLSATVTS